MSEATLTDAAVHRMIRRILTAPSTTSDSLLVLAEGLDEASRWTDQNDAATFLADHAAALRKLAPCFADRTPFCARAAMKPLDAARILIRHHKPTEGEVANAFTAAPEETPLNALLGDLLTAAELEAGS
jgi:hypothetical protein